MTPTAPGIIRWTGNELAGSKAVDAPPYPILRMLYSIVGVLLAILILAAQRRDDRLATRREQMALQVMLLAEQKVSKLIELVEELRRDLPNVQGRVDLDAIEMTAPTNHGDTLKNVEKASEPESSEDVNESSYAEDENTTSKS